MSREIILSKLAAGIESGRLKPIKKAGKYLNWVVYSGSRIPLEEIEEYCQTLCFGRLYRNKRHFLWKSAKAKDILRICEDLIPLLNERKEEFRSLSQEISLTLNTPHCYGSISCPLTRWRALNGLSLYDLAKKLQVSAPAISNFENRKIKKFSGKWRARIATLDRYGKLERAIEEWFSGNVEQCKNQTVVAALKKLEDEYGREYGMCNLAAALDCTEERVHKLINGAVPSAEEALEIAIILFDTENPTIEQRQSVTKGALTL